MLRSDPVAHTLMLGALAVLETGTLYGDGPNEFAWVSDGGRVVAAALSTPPQPLARRGSVRSRPDDAEALATNNLIGVVGPGEAVGVCTETLDHALAEDVAGDDDQRAAGQRQRRVVEGNEIGDADDRARQGVIDHRHDLHGLPAREAAAGDQIADQHAIEPPSGMPTRAMISVSRIAGRPSVKITW